MPEQTNNVPENIQNIEHPSHRVWTAVALAAVIAIGGGLFFAVHQRVTTGGNDIKTAYTTQCKDFSIALKTSTRYNPVEGNGNTFGLYLERGTQETILVAEALPNGTNFRPLPVNTSITTRVFELPDINKSDTWEFKEPLIMNIFLNYLNTQTYSQQDFDAIADCLEKNKDAINDALATLSTSFPAEDRGFYYPVRIGGIAYSDPISLLPKPTSLGVIEKFLYRPDDLNTVDIKYTGEIYDIENGGYIGDVFAGSPAMTQYPDHYKAVKNEKGEDIISYVAKLQQQLGIKMGQIKTGQVSLKSATPGKQFNVISPNRNSGVATYSQGQKITVEMSSNAPGGTIKAYLKNAIKGVNILLASVPNSPNQMGIVSMTSSPLPALSPANDYYVEAVLLDASGATIATARNYGDITILSQKLSPPKVVSFTGPQTLKVGEEGTWHITATSNAEGNLDCIIFWDAQHTAQNSVLDSYSVSSSCSSGVESTFTTKYSAVGTYSIAAKVTQGDEQYGSSFLQITVNP